MKKFKKSLSALRIAITNLTRLGSLLLLSQKKQEQKRKFNILKGNFAPFYKTLSQYDIHAFLTPLWEKCVRQLESEFIPYPSFSFLKNPVIVRTMVVTSGGKILREELSFLEKHIPPENLRSLLAEDPMGAPLLASLRYRTSHNSIHQLYHLTRFAALTDCDVLKLHTIIEWGGGYGALAKLWRRYLQHPFTYILLDVPLLSCLQWLYLSTIFGEDHVHLLKDSHDSIQEGYINILPICFLEQKHLKGDLFISTWALSESSRYSQDYVISHHWFSCARLLLAFQKSSTLFPDAGRFGELMHFADTHYEEISFLPGNYYAFR